ncbi:unnamed protein product [Rotaria sp. Silwood1]|nr:unnamed protein product [Rotaria sp. Silwood1]
MAEPDMIADIVGRPYAHDYVKPDVFVNVFKPLIGSHNLLVSEGHEHKRARQMLNAAFHFVNLRSMVSIMTNETAKAIDRYFSISQSKYIDLHMEMSNLTLSIIMSSAFVITDRRQGRSISLCAGSDLLDLLLSAVDSDGHSFTDEEIKDQPLTFVLAGHETTSNLMAWVMYVLMTNESVFRACREEVDKMLPSGTDPTYELACNLVVREAILQETLCLYSPAPLFVRKCIREHIIRKEGQRQLHIPAGTTIVINSHALHRRVAYWSRPLEFDYTRWMRDPITDLKPKLSHRFCYLPFAAGPHNCIGQRFAMLEAKLMLAMLVEQCDFIFEPGQKIVPEFIITMRPKYGLRTRVSKRL